MSRLALADLLLRDPAAFVLVKVTVLLALASGAAAVATRFSAARRHMLWLVALSSCVWLVVSSPIVPEIMIRTSLLAREAVVTAPRPTAAALPIAGSATTVSSRGREPFTNTEGVQRASLRSIPLSNHPVVALWIIGCVVLLVRHVIGFVGMTRLARRASIASDDETARELAAAAAAVGVRRHVRLGYSADVQTPITFGVATPFVLLPTEARSWSIERRRAVLVHESAHIARGDWLSQTIGRLGCALFWFHPLAWRAFAHLRDEAERAADDCVLRSGMAASEYATHLLELAHRTSNARPNLVAIGIVSTNDLEQRFVAMFDVQRSRTIVSSRARAITTSVALAVVCPLASLRVAPPAPLHAAQRVSPVHHTSAPSVSTAATPEWNESRVSQTVRVMRAIDALKVNVTPATLETPQAPIAVVVDSTPSAILRPNFSGKWKVDTVMGAVVDDHVNDSTIITQSANAISIESRGHALDAPTHNRVLKVPFDGSEVTGVVVTGNAAATFDAKVEWMGDTLIVISHTWVSGRDLRTFERFRLSPDGNTLSVTNSTFVDGNLRLLGGPLTVVLRRMSR
jgi:beta-lactamase regulating signal transducer with metallopeptidase domain